MPAWEGGSRGSGESFVFPQLQNVKTHAINGR